MEPANCDVYKPGILYKELIGGVWVGAPACVGGSKFWEPLPLIAWVGGSAVQSRTPPPFNISVAAPLC